MAIAKTESYNPSKSEIRLLKKIGGLVEEVTDFQKVGDSENYTLDIISYGFIVRRVNVQNGKVISIDDR